MGNGINTNSEYTSRNILPQNRINTPSSKEVSSFSTTSLPKGFKKHSPDSQQISAKSISQNSSSRPKRVQPLQNSSRFVRANVVNAKQVQDFLDAEANETGVVRSPSSSKQFEVKKIEISQLNSESGFEFTTKLLNPHKKEIQAKINDLGYKLQEVSNGKKLTVNGEGHVIPIERDSRFGIPFFADRTGKSPGAKEALRAVFKECKDIVDSIQTAGSSQEAAILHQKFELGCEGSWIKQALKANPELSNEFTAIHKLVKDCIKNSVSKDVKSAINDLKSHSIITNGMKGNATLAEMRSAVDLLKQIEEKRYGIDLSKDAIEAYNLSTDVKSMLEDLHNTISTPLTQTFFQKSFPDLFVKKDSSSEVSLTSADMKKITDFIRQYSRKSCLNAFQNLSDPQKDGPWKNLLVRQEGSNTSLPIGKALSKTIYQMSFQEFFQDLFLPNATTTLLASIMQESKKTISMSLFSDNRLSCDEIIAELRTYVSQNSPFSSEVEKQVAEFIEEVLYNNAGTSLMTRERVEELASIGTTFLSASSEKIIKAKSAAIESITYLQNSQGNAASLDQLISEVATLNPSSEKYDAQLVSQLKTASLDLLHFEAKTPEYSIDDILNSAMKDSSKYKKALLLLSQEFREINRAAFKNMPTGLFSLSPSLLEKQPAVLQMVEIGNRTGEFIIKNVLERKDPESRKKMVEFFIDLMKVSLEEGNYSTGITMYGSLNSTALSAILNDNSDKTTGTGVIDEAHLKTFKECAELLQSSKSSSNLRADIHKKMESGKAIFPPLSLYTGDRTFFEEGNPASVEISHTKFQGVGKIAEIISYTKEKLSGASSPSETNLFSELRKVEVAPSHDDHNLAQAYLQEVRAKLSGAISSEKSLISEYREIVKSTQNAKKFLQQHPEIQKNIDDIMRSVLFLARGGEKRLKIAVLLESGIRKHIEARLKSDKNAIFSTKELLSVSASLICSDTRLTYKEKQDIVRRICQDEYNQLKADPSEYSLYNRICAQSKAFASELASDASIVSLGQSLTEAYLLTHIIHPSINIGDSVVSYSPEKGLLSDEVEKKILDHLVTVEERKLIRTNSEEVQGYQTVENSESLSLIDRLKYQAKLFFLNKTSFFFKKIPNTHIGVKSLVSLFTKSGDIADSESISLQKNDRKLSMYQIIQNSVENQIQVNKHASTISQQQVFSELFADAFEKKMVDSANQDACMRLFISHGHEYGSHILEAIDSNSMNSLIYTLSAGNKADAVAIKSQILLGAAQNLFHPEVEKRSLLTQDTIQDFVEKQLVGVGVKFKNIRNEEKLIFFEKMLQEKRGADLEGLMRLQSDIESSLTSFEENARYNLDSDVIATIKKDLQLTLVIQSLQDESKPVAVDIGLLEEVSSKNVADIFRYNPDKKTVANLFQKIEDEHSYIQTCLNESTAITADLLNEIRGGIERIEELGNVLPSYKSQAGNGLFETLLPFIADIREKSKIIDYTVDPLFGPKAALDPERGFLNDLLKKTDSKIYLGKIGFSDTSLQKLNSETQPDLTKYRTEKRELPGHEAAKGYMEEYANFLKNKGQIDEHKNYLRKMYLGEFKRQYPDDV